MMNVSLSETQKIDSNDSDKEKDISSLSESFVINLNDPRSLYSVQDFETTSLLGISSTRDISSSPIVVDCFDCSDNHHTRLFQG